MESFQLYSITGNIAETVLEGADSNQPTEANEATSGKVAKCADMKAYMRNYMKSYYKEYRIDNIEKAKFQERRKYWRKKLRNVGVIMSNDDLEKYSQDDCNLIFDYIRVKKSMEEKPELFKFIP